MHQSHATLAAYKAHREQQLTRYRALLRRPVFRKAVAAFRDLLLAGEANPLNLCCELHKGAELHQQKTHQAITASLYHRSDG